jgi:predicted DNA-binding transcriptional regulator AlpA
MANSILRLPGVIARVGLSRSAIYLALSKAEFPRPVQLGARSVGWLELEFKPHLHTLVSTTGLGKVKSELVSGLYFPKDIITRRWRHAFLAYLKRAFEEGMLRSDRGSGELYDLFEEHQDLWWKGGVEWNKSKFNAINYMSRYLRRPPIAEYHIESFDHHEVRFSTKDTINQSSVLVKLPVTEFIDRIENHISEPYRHSVHYFGLLAPRSINTRLRIFFKRLGQKRTERPRPMRWAESIRLTFHRDPLLAANGERFTKVGILPPKRELSLTPT